MSGSEADDRRTGGDGAERKRLRADLERLRAERDEARQRAEESEALHVLGLAANRSLDATEVIELIARSSRMLLGAHYTIVCTAEGDRVRTAAAAGLRGDPGDADDPLARLAVTAGRPVRAAPHGSPRPADFPLHAREGMVAGLAVPLSLFGETLGALVVGYRRDYNTTPRDERLALSLAGHAAVAISNARLHGALAERSAELQRAYEELRWNAEAKDRFFASMSHELRTPLNAVLGYQSLLLDGVPAPVPGPLRPYLEHANRAARGLLFLVNDVLDLSRLEAGKVDLVLRPCGLPAVVREAVATVDPMAAARSLPIEIDLDESLPHLTTDADRLRQILVNLLSNAVKFTTAGRVEVRVERATREAGEEIVLVHVRDTGPGVPEADSERIFHEFEQVAGVASAGGTGLGLPISRKLARLLGGDLRLSSTSGEGSTFTLSIPLENPGTGGT
jgi:signal transduction histidine kinase